MEFTEKMKQDVLAAAREYIASETDDVFRSEVENAVGLGDWEGLYDRFYTSLAFGTAGMRGIIGGGTNRINTYMVRKVTQGLADYLNASVKNPSTVIAYDSRLFSDKFALSAAKVLAANGVRVYLYDTLHPVPMLSFAVRHLKATSGIVVTASHNPSKYNGYKVYWSDGGQVTPPHDIEIAKRANAVKSGDIKDGDEKDLRASGLLSSVPASVDEAYYSMVMSSLRRPEIIKGAKIKVAYTPLHGTGNVPVRHMLSTLGIDCSVVKEQENPDGAVDGDSMKRPGIGEDQGQSQDNSRNGVGKGHHALNLPRDGRMPSLREIGHCNADHPADQGCAPGQKHTVFQAV